MKQFFASVAAVVAVIGVAPASAVTMTTYTPGTPNFQIAGNIASGPVTATLSHNGIAEGAFEDTFLFTIDQDGVGSGSVTTGTTSLFSSTDLDIKSVLFNGLTASKTFSDDGKTEAFTISGVPIFFGELNRIVVSGTSRGLGSYGGNATFEPFADAVPEPASWALMIGGLGVAGGALRRRRPTNATVRFA